MHKMETKSGYPYEVNLTLASAESGHDSIENGEYSLFLKVTGREALREALINVMEEYT